MGKKIIIAILSIVLIIVVCFGLTYLPHKLINIEPSQVYAIDIFDGGTGRSISITDKSVIAHIIENLNAISFKNNGLSIGRMGYSFRTTIYKANSKIYKDFIINSTDTIRDDPFLYIDTTKSIDYNYIRKLFDEQIKNIILPGDEEKAYKVVQEYFNAFAKTDYTIMSKFYTDRHNKSFIHDGDVWGMKWAKAKEIKFVGSAELWGLSSW